MNRYTARSSAIKPSRLLALVAPLIVLATAVPARAGLVYSVESVGASAGAFDVLLTNTGSSAVNLDSFAFEVTVSTPSGPAVTLTDATIFTTTAPYVFAGQSNYGPDISLGTSNGGQTLDASDAYAILNTDVSVAAGATVGLGYVTFDATGLSTTATVLFTPVGNLFPANSLADSQGNNLPITAFNSGTISPAIATIPEPSAIMLVSIGLAMAGAGCFLGRSRPKSVAVGA